MIRGECILCFAPDLWSDIWRNRHRLLTLFARENRVLYLGHALRFFREHLLGQRPAI